MKPFCILAFSFILLFSLISCSGSPSGSSDPVPDKETEKIDFDGQEFIVANEYGHKSIFFGDNLHNDDTVCGNLMLDRIHSLEKDTNCTISVLYLRENNREPLDFVPKLAAGKSVCDMAYTINGNMALQ